MKKQTKEQEDYTEEENMIYKLLLDGTEEDIHKVAKEITDGAYSLGFEQGKLAGIRIKQKKLQTENNELKRRIREMEYVNVKILQNWREQGKAQALKDIESKERFCYNDGLITGKLNTIKQVLEKFDELDTELRCIDFERLLNENDYQIINAFFKEINKTRKKVEIL